jgi:hypothetical protein
MGGFSYFNEHAKEWCSRNECLSFSLETIELMFVQYFMFVLKVENVE